MISDFYFHNIYKIKIENLDDKLIKYIKKIIEKRIETRFR